MSHSSNEKITLDVQDHESDLQNGQIKPESFEEVFVKEEEVFDSDTNGDHFQNGQIKPETFEEVFVKEEEVFDSDTDGDHFQDGDDDEVGPFDVKEEIKEEDSDEAMPQVNPRKRKYSKDDVEKAIIDMMDNGLSLRQASTKYDIPATTLRDKKNGKYVEGKTRPGPAACLRPDQELLLAKWIKKMVSVGYGRTKLDIPLIVKELLDKNPEPSKFKDNLPSLGWVYRFLNRHPELSCLTTEALGSARPKVAEEDIKAWFTNLVNYIEEEVGLEAKDFLNEENAHRIFKCDEFGFPLIGSKGKLKVITEKIAKDENKEQITVLGCVSASGVYLPPLVIYPGERREIEFGDEASDTLFVGWSKKGWIDRQVFFNWVSNCFYPSLVKNKIQFPILLFMDGHFCHSNLALVEFCREKNILVFFFPARASHVMHPLDISVFGPIKKHWNDELELYKFNHPDKPVTKTSFIPVFKAAWVKAFKPENAKSGFKESGIVPLDPTAIDFSKFVLDCPKNIPIQKPVSNSMVERLAYRRCLNIFDKNIDGRKIKKYKKQLEEGYDVEEPKDEIWTCYKEIHDLLKSATALSATVTPQSSQNGRNVAIASEGTPERSREKPFGFVENFNQPSSADAGPDASEQIDLENYGTSPFNSLIKLPSSFVKNNKKSKNKKIPQALEGSNYAEHSHRKYNKRLNEENTEEDTKKQREERQISRRSSIRVTRRQNLG